MTETPPNPGGEPPLTLVDIARLIVFVSEVLFAVGFLVMLVRFYPLGALLIGVPAVTGFFMWQAAKKRGRE